MQLVVDDCANERERWTAMLLDTCRTSYGANGAHTVPLAGVERLDFAEQPARCSNGACATTMSAASAGSTTPSEFLLAARHGGPGQRAFTLAVGGAPAAFDISHFDAAPELKIVVQQGIAGP
jgi:hypothetical protein